MHIKT